MLRRPVGGAEVMRAQIDHSVRCLEFPKVRIQIMRFAAGPHPGAFGPFHYFRFGFSELPDVVYTESLAGAQLLRPARRRRRRIWRYWTGCPYRRSRSLGPGTILAALRKEL